MHINYRILPTDYIQELHNQGKREKARCFMEYYFDMQAGAVNSIGFYAISWGTKEKPKSKGSVHKWIAEFVKQIDLFYAAQSLHNSQHYSSVKKQSERQVNGKRTEERPQTPTTPSVEKTERTASERQVNEVNIINNTNSARERAWFDNFYFIYRMNNKYAGNKRDALSVYLSMNIRDPKLLALAGLQYCHDNNVDMKVGARRFLEDEIYLGYIPKIITVKVNGEWLTGEYDSDKEIFTDKDDKRYQLTAEKLIEKFGTGELEFVRGVAA